MKTKTFTTEVAENKKFRFIKKRLILRERREGKKYGFFPKAFLCVLCG